MNNAIGKWEDDGSIIIDFESGVTKKSNINNNEVTRTISYHSESENTPIVENPNKGLKRKREEDNFELPKKIIKAYQIDLGNGESLTVYKSKKLPQFSIPWTDSNYELVKTLRKDQTNHVYTERVLARKENKFYVGKRGKKVTREIQVLLSLKKHPNIIDLVHYHINNEKNVCFYVMEHGIWDLWRQLIRVRKSGKRFYSKAIYTILIDVCKGLIYLHKNHYVHTDIKPENIILSEDGNYKIIDFGLARKMDFVKKGFGAQREGTLMFMAPEIFFDYFDHDEKIDIWSLGIIFIELCLNKPLTEFYPSMKHPLLFIDKYIEKLNILPYYPEVNAKFVHYRDYDAIEHLIAESKKRLKKNETVEPLDNTIYGIVDSVVGNKGLNLLKKMLKIDPRERIDAEQLLKELLNL